MTIKAPGIYTATQYLNEVLSGNYRVSLSKRGSVKVIVGDSQPVTRRELYKKINAGGEPIDIDHLSEAFSKIKADVDEQMQNASKKQRRLHSVLSFFGKLIYDYKAKLQKAVAASFLPESLEDLYLQWKNAQSFSIFKKYMHKCSSVSKERVQEFVNFVIANWEDKLFDGGEAAKLFLLLDSKREIQYVYSMEIAYIKIQCGKALDFFNEVWNRCRNLLNDEFNSFGGAKNCLTRDRNFDLKFFLFYLEFELTYNAKAFEVDKRVYCLKLLLYFYLESEDCLQHKPKELIDHLFKFMSPNIRWFILTALEQHRAKFSDKDRFEIYEGLFKESKVGVRHDLLSDFFRLANGKNRTIPIEEWFEELTENRLKGMNYLYHYFNAWDDVSGEPLSLTQDQLMARIMRKWLKGEMDVYEWMTQVSEQLSGHRKWYLLKALICSDSASLGFSANRGDPVALYLNQDNRFEKLMELNLFGIDREEE